jgi:hypothetical protein
MKKYLCIGDGAIEAAWLPRWYKVPVEECVFQDSNEGYFELPNYPDWYLIRNKKLVILKPRPNKDYDIKIAKTEHLLNGGNDGTGIYE